MKRRYILIFLLVAIAATAYKPIQKPHKKGLHQKYTATEREETVYKWWLNTLPQYHLWQKKKKDLARWQQKYAALPLPDSAVIIDEKVFETPNGKRTIVAWMTHIDIDIHTYEYSVYDGCPASTQGSGYYRGDLYFSLLNTANAKTINTINVVKYDNTAMIYPFSIANPVYQPELFGIIYAARGGSKKTDGEADIIHFIDFNNDGKAYEFALFSVDACIPPMSTLIGYNETNDSLKWYDWDMTVKYTGENFIDSTYAETQHWPGSVMRIRMDKSGNVKYYDSYLGRGGSLERYYMHYDKATDTYSGLLDARSFPGNVDDSIKGWMTSKEIRDKYKYK